jgi:hypothetical protein
MGAVTDIAATVYSAAGESPMVICSTVPAWALILATNVPVAVERVLVSASL